MRNVETDHLLGRNDIIVNELIADYAALQATYDTHVKDLKVKIKQESLLNVWYSEHIVSSKDTFKSVYNYLIQLSTLKGFTLPDIKILADMYKSRYNSRIDELKLVWK